MSDHTSADQGFEAMRRTAERMSGTPKPDQPSVEPIMPFTPEHASDLRRDLSPLPAAPEPHKPGCTARYIRSNPCSCAAPAGREGDIEQDIDFLVRAHDNPDNDDVGRRNCFRTMSIHAREALSLLRERDRRIEELQTVLGRIQVMAAAGVPHRDIKKEAAAAGRRKGL